MKEFTATPNNGTTLDVIELPSGAGGGTINVGAVPGSEILNVTGAGNNLVAVTYQEPNGNTYTTLMKLPTGQRVNTRQVSPRVITQNRPQYVEPKRALVKHYEGKSGGAILALMILGYVGYKCIQSGLVHATNWINLALGYWSEWVAMTAPHAIAAGLCIGLVTALLARSVWSLFKHIMR